MAAHTIKTSRAQYQNVDDETSPLGGGGLGGHLAGGCRATKRVCSRPALVATIYGATGGVLGATVSLTVNNALFEISVVPYFAIVIGLVLMMLGGTMAQVHPAPGPAPAPDTNPKPERGHDLDQRAMEEAHEALQTRIVKAGWAAVVLLAGASCFLLERHWNAATSPMFKTPIYMILGAALSFTVPSRVKRRLDRPELAAYGSRHPPAWAWRPTGLPGRATADWAEPCSSRCSLRCRRKCWSRCV